MRSINAGNICIDKNDQSKQGVATPWSKCFYISDHPTVLVPDLGELFPKISPNMLVPDNNN